MAAGAARAGGAGAAHGAELPVYARLPFTPARGAGCYLYDADGEAYLDFYGAHAVALTGHCHPHVVRAIQEQASRLLFYSSAAPSPEREAASRLLLAHAPYPESRVFHCCSGSEANEAAFKLARTATGRRTVVSFGDSFHGRTLAALSACGIASYRATAGPVTVEEHVQVPFGDLTALGRAVDGDTAAIIVEPVQSLGGVCVADPETYRAIARLARERGAALIFDEVQTGLGRTGSYFFADQVGVKPDLITLAKGLASGIPAAAVIVAPHLAATVKLGDHGSTFGGGHIAMAAMRATLEVIERERLVDNARVRSGELRAAIEPLPGVRAVRGAGLLLGVVLDRPAKIIQQALLRRRVVAGTSHPADVLRVLPPLTLGRREVDTFVAALRAALAETR